MTLFLDSFWRAAAYCLLPRVVLLSLAPLVLIIALTLGLGYFFWQDALDQVRTWMDAFAYIGMVGQWLDSLGLGRLKVVLAPLLVVLGVTPLIVIGSLLAVAMLMTPALVDLVAKNRFPSLETKQGAGLLASLLWALSSVALACVALLVSLPLWLVPPLVLVIPPLIWGWLTYRVMAFDALAKHASRDERRMLVTQYSGWLWAMGVVCGFLGAAPSVLWATGAGFVPAFVILAPAAIWVYMLVFAFASLWFAHFCLAALQALRAQNSKESGVPVPNPAESMAVQAVPPLTWKDDSP